MSNRKKWGRRHVVNVGDVVQGRGTMRWGVLIGVVAKVLDQNEVIVNALAADNEDLGNNNVRWLLQTRVPKGKTPSGDDRADLVPHIARVIHRAVPLPPKPQPVKIAVEIRDEETLIEHLSGQRELGRHEFPILAIGDDNADDA